MCRSVMRYMLHGFEPVVWISKLSNDKGLVGVSVGRRVLKPMFVTGQFRSNLEKSGGEAKTRTSKGLSTTWTPNSERDFIASKIPLSKRTSIEWLKHSIK
mmetsp:Transcript_21495/g.40136  ORF Transcript_21495/g.40136 Transcript_21495/m.40136 type:complete len:100 (-) Transcript_21495:437-736(-)